MRPSPRRSACGKPTLSTSASVITSSYEASFSSVSPPFFSDLCGAMSALLSRRLPMLFSRVNCS
jgi:hypothetical protein